MSVRRQGDPVERQAKEAAQAGNARRWLALDEKLRRVDRLLAA